jgi:hypothetical protein
MTTAEMTTAAHEPNPRRGPRARRQVLAAGLAAVLLASACAQSADGPDVAVGEVGEFAATTEYLADLAGATDGRSYRLSMDMSMTFSGEGEHIEMSGTIMTGETDGEWTSMTMDMGEILADMTDDVGGEAVPDELLDDLMIEMVTDEETLYMRAPYFAALADMAADAGASPSDVGPLADLADLGDEWGRIDLSAISTTEVASAAGTQASDPSVFLDIIARGTDVEELGTETIDGIEAHGLAATVTYADMIEAQGMDLDDMREQMTPGSGTSGDDAEAFEGFVERLLALEIPLEVWVDDDDLVRRIRLDLDMTSILRDTAVEAGDDIGDASMAMSMAMEFTDYGDASIEIEIPDDAVDITDAFLDLAESGGVQTGPSPTPFGMT